MKELTAYFNELSQTPFCSPGNEAERVHTFMHLLRSICDLGFSRLRIGVTEHSNWMISDTMSLQAYLYQNNHREEADFFYTHVDSPIIENNSGVESKINILHPKLLRDGTEYDCVGLVVAYFYDTISICFDSEPFWRSVNFTLQINNKKCSVYAFSREEDLDNASFKIWLDGKQDVEILKTDIPVHEKTLNLCGDHHGKKELARLGKKLLNKDYIEGVICSVKNAGKVSDPIIEVYDDGFIDVAHIGTDVGYALKVKTTGRNRRETEYIADLIRKIVK